MATPATLLSLTRHALIARARGNAGLTALVPAASIEPVGVPTWPHILFRTPTAARLNAACVRGAAITYDVHAFARAKLDGTGAETQTGHDHTLAIASAIETVFADNLLTLSNGAKCRIRFSDTQLLQDEAPDDWHWFGQLNCRVLSAPA